MDCLAQWIDEVRPDGSGKDEAPLWPTERSGRITADTLSREFTILRTELGLTEGIDLHSLRRSYVTHLIEDGYDALFVQHQVGHEYASTTALHTGVSSDYRTRTPRAAMNKMAAEAAGTEPHLLPGMAGADTGSH